MKLRAVTEFFHNGKSVHPGEEIEFDGDLPNDLLALVQMGRIERVADDAPPRVADDPTPKQQQEQHESHPVEPMSTENAAALVPPGRKPDA